jgi:hypothetical protein
MKSIMPFLLLIFVCNFIEAQDYPIDLNLTAKYFKEIKAICDSDNGKLWGENLWAPILLIDTKTRFVVANMPDKEGLLRKTGEVYTGYFPKDKAISNSTTDFRNENWMMVMYPLPNDDYSRNQLCVHELYHRLQKKLKLNFSNCNNDHLDNMDARILMKLEWLALEKAITEENTEKKIHCLTDALLFRNYRRILYPGKDTTENNLEIHEGIADYTGYKICSKDNEEFKNYVLKARFKTWDNKSYVRSFAYYSGTLYGYILDQTNSGWIENIKPNSDLGLIIQRVYRIKLPENPEKSYEKSRMGYNYEEIFQFESEREKKRQEILASYRFRFTKDTVLILNILKPNVSFDPRTLVPLDTLGVVYPTIKIIAEWGILQVNEGGCLFDWKKAIVSGHNIKQENNILKGDGWELELNPNWKLIHENLNYGLQNDK